MTDLFDALTLAVANWERLAVDEAADHIDQQRDPAVADAVAGIVNAALMLTREPPKPGPLLQCISCNNTESPAGAMARQFNHGRCVFCGSYFKVVRA